VESFIAMFVAAWAAPLRESRSAAWLIHAGA